MILNSNIVDKISKKMIIELQYESIVNSPRILCGLYQYFSIDNKIQAKLAEDVEILNKKAIYEFNSIGSQTDKNSWEYNIKPKYISFYSQAERDMLIKELYSLGLACKYPAFLCIDEKYYFLNELKFTEYDKEQESCLVDEKYENLDCFIIENIYGLEALEKKGYKKEDKQYKMIK